MAPMIGYDPYSAEAMSDPHPLYRELRRQAPVYSLPQYDALALSRFEDVWGVIADGKRFTIAEGPVFAPAVIRRPFSAERSPPYDPRQSFASWDPPVHTELRARIRGHMTPRRAARLADDARRIARARLEELTPRGRLDVVRDLAAHVAVGLSCIALGVPEAHGVEFVRLSNRFARRDEGRAGISDGGMAAQVRMVELLLDAVRERRAAGAPDGAPRVIDSLLDADLAGRPMTDDEVARQLMTLLTGGSETVPKITAGGVLELARHPGQRAALVDDPSGIPGAFEEMVRHQGVLQSIGRTALEPLEVAGVRVEAGQRLFLLLQSANRDEREFEDPDAFDVRRRPERHLGFGHGPHHCPGSHLARTEGRVLLEELLACIPEWEVDLETAERPPSEFQIGYTSLPIEFDADAATAALRAR